MDDEEYSESEQELISRLPALPPTADLRASNIWIVEWLSETEPKTGRKLHEWMEANRPGWSMYITCTNKADVIKAIERATAFTRRTNQIPVLHIEAHGDELGLEGPNGFGDYERLMWDEITDSLQALNLLTRCNLLVVVAACSGFSGISALTRGPRAPAIVLVGPIDRLTESDLLRAMKEFYRRWQDGDPRMREMVDSASRETAGVDLEFEPFATLFYESLIHDLIRRLRQAKVHAATGNMAAAVSMFPPAVILQRVWDEMFMLDVEPGNRTRFGIDMELVLGPFLSELGLRENRIGTPKDAHD